MREFVCNASVWVAWGVGIVLVVAFLGGCVAYGDDGSDDE